MFRDKNEEGMGNQAYVCLQKDMLWTEEIVSIIKSISVMHYSKNHQIFYDKLVGIIIKSKFTPNLKPERIE